MNPMKEERSVSELVSNLTNEASALIRNEVELAKAEISQKVSQVGSGVTSIAAGGAILYAGFLVLLAALVAAIHEAFGLERAWISPLIVGLVVALIGGIMLMRGRSNLKAKNLKPKRVIATLRRDREFAREQLQ